MNAGSIGQSIINGTYGSDSKPLTAYEELKAWCEKWNIPHSLESNFRQGVKYICFKEGVVIISDSDIAFVFDTDDGKPLQLRQTILKESRG